MIFEAFPYTEKYFLNTTGHSYTEILETLGPIITANKKAKINRAVEKRTYRYSLFLESIYDSGNVNAVMRTAEGLGLQSLHVLPSEEIKNSTRITMGAEKWLDLNYTENAVQTIRGLKSSGHQIIGTHLSKQAVSLYDLDLTRPTIFVLGNEQRGISDSLLNEVDQNCLIPMTGLSQSLNISVAAAIIMGHLISSISLNRPQLWDLSPLEKNLLCAEFYLRTLPNFHRYF